MSWQIGAFAILGVALLAGFAWYERGRPDARVVALVATLAAFAALGRIAFAALPNIKPTTDIVLIAGYALGGAPGFAVGALAGLSSNFFFGQGPWTPWQMAAWGVTGLIGAGLARIAGPRLGRWPLAAICAVSGFGFTAVQDCGDWVTFSDHSLASLGAYVGRGVPFDLVHAGGCAVFALAFGPALARSIARFTRRLAIEWAPALPGSLPVLVLACALVLAGGLAAVPQARAASSLDYLLAAQNPDGGFGPAPGSPSSSMFSGWAALALAGDGRNPRQVSHGGASVIDYLRGGAGAIRDTGSLERTILVVHAAGLSPYAFAGRDLVAALRSEIKPDGSVAQQVNLTAFAILALQAAGVSPPARSLAWLVVQQDSDGGFNFATRGGSSDADDTGAALEALAGAPGAGAARARRRAVAYLDRTQNRDGGFPADAGGVSDAQSTAWAIQGLIAAGADPLALHRRGAPSPEAFLSSLTLGDGAIRYSRASATTPVWVTAQAMVALAGKPLPLAPVPLAAAAAHHPARRASGSRPAPAPRAGHRAAADHARARSRGPSRHSATTVRSAAPDAQVQRLATLAGALAAVALAPVS